MNQAPVARQDFSSDLPTVASRDGIPIAYRRSGNADGTKLLLVHSLALDGGIWDGVARLLTDEADIVQVDCRGHGASGRPRGPYSVEQMADDLADLMSALGWRHAVVTGCSMGGCIAQSFAARHAGKTQALGLIDTTAWHGPTAPEDWRGRAEKARTDGFAAMAHFQTTRWFGDRFRRDQPDIVQRYVDIFNANDVDAYAATCEMMGKLDLRVSSSTIKVPTAVIVGEEDYAAPIAMARQLADLIEDSTLTVLPMARHLTPIECPEAIAGEIRSLIARTR